VSAITIHTDASPARVIRPIPLGVYVAGRRRRDLHVEAWSVLPAPDFGVAAIGLAMSSRHGCEHRLEDLAALPPVGSELQIRLLEPVPYAVFEGFVTKHIARIGPDVEGLGIEVEDNLRTRLSAPVTGRWQLSGASPTFVPNEKCIFNDELEGLASTVKYTVNSRPCRVFHPGPAGQLWSVADILGYLLAACVPEDVIVPQPEELERMAAALYPPRISLAGMAVGEAIAKVAGLGGLAARGGISFANGLVTRALVFYRPGRVGRRRRIGLQRYGQSLDTRRSNLWKAKVVFRRRPRRRGVLLIGDMKRYESTFELKRGWNANLESYEYSDFVRSTAPDWLAVKDVFRKWVLNESGQYCGDPYNFSTYEFSTVSDEDFFLATPRRFRPCLSLDSTGRSIGVVFEVSYDGGSNWRRYGGPIRISTEECAIYLGDDALPADYFQAAVAETIKARVTATVESDRRISAQVDGDPGCGLEVIEMSKARWAKVHSGSVFYQREDLPAPAERDDTQCLIRLARNISESAAGTVQAELTLGWLNPSCNVGDIVERIEGRDLGLVPFPGAAPHVRAVEHRCGEEWTTHLTVSG